MNILDKNKFGSTSIDELKRFEENFKILLPDDYKEFLLNYNGGKPSKPLISFVEGNQKTTTNIRLFLGIHNGPNWARLDFFLKNERITKGRIPFACDDGGNAFVFNVEDNYVYFEDHESDKLWLVAENFTKFLSLLHEAPNLLDTIDDAIEQDNLQNFLNFISRDEINLQSRNEYDRYWTEECAIYGANSILEYLVRKVGVPLQQSSFYASRNSNESTLCLIKELKNKV